MDRFFEFFPLAALSCLFALGIGRALLLYAHGVSVIAVDWKRSPVDLLLDALLIATGAFWIVEVAAKSLPWLPAVPLPDALLFDNLPCKVLGTVMLSAGPLLYGLALEAFGKSWRIGIDREHHGPLATQGIFALSRNPIYLSMNIFFIGTFAVSGRLIFLLLALALIGQIHALILREERFLRQAYGQDYEDYCRRTSRYFTFHPGERGRFEKHLREKLR